MDNNTNNMEYRINLEKQNKRNDQVTELILDNCRASQISGLTDEFVNLEMLSLINVGLVTLKGFPKLPKLKKLELSDNRLSGGLNLLHGSPKLQYLNISGNRIKDWEVLEPLKEFKELVTLDLYNCDVTKAEDYRKKVFELIPNLHSLDGYDRFDCEVADSEESDDEGSEVDNRITHDNNEVGDEEVDDDDDQDDEDDGESSSDYDEEGEDYNGVEGAQGFRGPVEDDDDDDDDEELDDEDDDDDDDEEGDDDDDEYDDGEPEYIATEDGLISSDGQTSSNQAAPGSVSQTEFPKNDKLENGEQQQLQQQQQQQQQQVDNDDDNEVEEVIGDDDVQDDEEEIDDDDHEEPGLRHLEKTLSDEESEDGDFEPNEEPDERDHEIDPEDDVEEEVAPILTETTESAEAQPIIKEVEDSTNRGTKRKHEDEGGDEASEVVEE